MHVDDEVPGISMSNTKKEMLAAYNEVKEMLAARATAVRDAEKEKAELRKEAARAVAESASAGEPINLIQALRTRMTSELGGLADEYEQLTHEHQQLCEAVEDRKADLERVYEVGTAAEDLVALIEAHRRLKDDLAAEMASARAAWRREKEEWEEALGREKETVARSRAWEEEEFAYSITREHEKRRDELEDELSALQKDLVSKREKLEREVADRESELAQREAAALEREERAEALEQEVAGLDDVIAAKTTQAVAEVRRQLAQEHAGKEALLKAVFEGEKNVLLSKIESLEQLVERQGHLIENLTAEQQQAYQKVQDIASKALESAKGSPSSPPAQFGIRPRREESEE